MKTKTIILILIIICGYFISSSIVKFTAKTHNNNELSKMESTILHEFEVNEIAVLDVESQIYGESYFMLSETREPKLESCIYSTRVEFNEGFDFDRVSSLIPNLNNQENNQFDVSFYKKKNSITISKRASIPLGSKYSAISMNDDNTTTVAPEDWFYPLSFYDPRCRTIIMHNGA